MLRPLPVAATQQKPTVAVSGNAPATDGSVNFGDALAAVQQKGRAIGPRMAGSNVGPDIAVDATPAPPVAKATPDLGQAATGLSLADPAIWVKPPLPGGTPKAKPGASDQRDPAAAADHATVQVSDAGAAVSLGLTATLQVPNPAPPVDPQPAPPSLGPAADGGSAGAVKPPAAPVARSWDAPAKPGEAPVAASVSPAEQVPDSSERSAGPGAAMQPAAPPTGAPATQPPPPTDTPPAATLASAVTPPPVPTPVSAAPLPANAPVAAPAVMRALSPTTGQRPGIPAGKPPATQASDAPAAWPPDTTIGAAGIIKAGVGRSAGAQTDVVSLGAPGHPPAALQDDDSESQSPVAVTGNIVAAAISAASINPGTQTAPAAQQRPGQPTANEGASERPAARSSDAPPLPVPRADTQPSAPIQASAARPLPADRTGHASVAEQITPAVIMLAQAPGSGGKLSVSIAPDQLGQVHITVSRAIDGTTTIHVAAEQLATLDLLRQDQGSLNHALDQAGIGAGGHSLSFSWDGAAGGGRQSWYPQGDLAGEAAPVAPVGAYATDPPAARSSAAAAARGGIDVTA